MNDKYGVITIMMLIGTAILAYNIASRTCRPTKVKQIDGQVFIPDNQIQIFNTRPLTPYQKNASFVAHLPNSLAVLVVLPEEVMDYGCKEATYKSYVQAVLSGEDTPDLPELLNKCKEKNHEQEQQ